MDWELAANFPYGPKSLNQLRINCLLAALPEAYSAPRHPTLISEQSMPGPG